MDDLNWLVDGIDIGTSIRRLTKLFESRGFWGASQDARALVGHVVKLDYSGLVLRSNQCLAEQEVSALSRLIERRLAFEPVGRILASRDFRGLELEVSAATLEPREDTEILVEATLAALDDMPLHNAIIADLGTGTGAILIALLVERPECLGVAVDISPAALETASRNAWRHGVSERWLPVAGSYASSLSPGCYDLIVSNPPYIATTDIALLEPDVRNYDPVLALDGGPDGLVAYRQLAPDAFAALKSHGRLFVEIGFDQASAVTEILKESGFKGVSVLRDRGERDRVVMGFRP